MSSTFAYNLIISLLILFSSGCKSKKNITSPDFKQTPVTLTIAAAQFNEYLPLLKGKKVGMVVNHTSVVGNTHLIDTLLRKNVKIQCVFAPEHGFRGDADAGETINNEKDPLTGLPIYSLHGKTKKPTPQQLGNLDILVFDIQDVGVRFYTYISTLHLVMEACAEQNIPLVILDRPNPNGHYVDGPVLEQSFSSFVGMDPLPIVHGLTVGELANMINGEGWLGDNKTCKVHVIKCTNYTHQTAYEVPIPPSPNLPNNRAIYLYPSLCLFEGTVVSVGRGTNKQFQQFGHPDFKKGDASFTPQPNQGAKQPLYEGKTCYGTDLSGTDAAYFYNKREVDLSYLQNFYNSFADKSIFFNKDNYFDKLAGNDKLRKQIIKGVSENEIRASWQPMLDEYKKMRKTYLLYAE
ncbi:MAG: DUF1343 domain-containing protein [Saprospiraceae bacterium]|nr:DUF1343 domain-containing protein [Saprospiraceae bacterium]MBP7699873.1 DUF1343 domain-containing protein [Saprospiraceae bacterium]